MSWWKKLKGKISFNERLNKHTTFKIGGPCGYFIEPEDIDDLKLALSLLKKYHVPFLVIGAGSNVLVSDRGLIGAVLHLTAPSFTKLTFKGNIAETGAGCPLQKLISEAAKRALSGYELLSGIPGTVGGALVMNAGSGKNQRNFGDLVEKVTIMDYNSNIKVLTGKQLKFSYRKSNLSGCIILSARIKFNKGNKKEAAGKIREYLSYRKNSQDSAHPSAGCIFKNPVGFSAGKLIDSCGLKGSSIGRASISLKHANFIINRGKASSGDVMKLIALAKRKVKNKFNIDLKPEIQIWR
ncbi:MAG: UDP-N-acetylmuramate dehydrogenase [Candidatus Omnitrophica bacterium]|jgi:UDP-N-acetylmuramate dehydrogenase|nr:UDP-N-acetylmuramate dehydrogenase [Candidatus Omnitrophota bacterium]